MRGVIFVATVLAAIPAAARADEPLVAVDCLCLWEDTGSFAAFSDDPPGRRGLPAVVPRGRTVLTTES